MSGWWFGTFFIFPYIGFLIIPIDFHIFQRGGPTTNQFNFVWLPISFIFSLTCWNPPARPEKPRSAPSRARGFSRRRSLPQRLWFLGGGGRNMGYRIYPKLPLEQTGIFNTTFWDFTFLYTPFWYTIDCTGILGYTVFQCFSNKPW